MFQFLPFLKSAGRWFPRGRPVGERLIHHDTKSQQLMPDANAGPDWLIEIEAVDVAVINQPSRQFLTRSTVPGSMDRPNPGDGPTL